MKFNSKYSLLTQDFLSNEFFTKLQEAEISCESEIQINEGGTVSVTSNEKTIFTGNFSDASKFVFKMDGRYSFVAKTKLCDIEDFIYSVKEGLVKVVPSKRVSLKQ